MKRSSRRGTSDVVFRPLKETINVISIAAAWNPKRRKELIPALVTIAAEIGANREALPLPAELEA